VLHTHGKARREIYRPRSILQGHCRTYSLIRNDLHTLHVSSRLENLSEYLFRDAWIKAADIQRPLVWLWRSSADKTARACWRQYIPRGWRSHCSGYGIIVLRYNDGRERWRRHVRIGLAIAARSTVVRHLAGCSGRRWWRRRQGSERGRRDVFGHLSSAWKRAIGLAIKGNCRGKR
jgi:hypothetical protein